MTRLGTNLGPLLLGVPLVGLTWLATKRAVQLGESPPNRTYDIAYDRVVVDTTFATAP